MKIKIMNYNILNGFCGDNPPYLLDKKRMNFVIKVIKKESPDILILTEAYFWSFVKKVDMKKLGDVLNHIYNQYANLAYDQFRKAPIILSKLEVKYFDSSLSKYLLNFLRADLKIGNKKITVDVFHPHPDTTEEEKSDFLKEVFKNKKKNYILAGDLNALSLEDSYDKKKLVKGYESFMKSKGKSKVEDMLRGLTIKTILDNGLRDTYKIKNKKLDFTMPTDLRSKNKDSSVRLDYIFCSKNIIVKESKIIKNKLTEKASDHYPITALVEI